MLPRSIQLLAYSELSLPMSSTLLSAITLPWFANFVSRAGLGAEATSGGLPAVTRVVRMASWSRLASYSTVTPVWSSKGLMTAMKESCSDPDQVPRKCTVPPILPLVVLPLLLFPPQAARTMAAPRATIVTTLKLLMRIYNPLAAHAGRRIRLWSELIVRQLV